MIKVDYSHCLCMSVGTPHKIIEVRISKYPHCLMLVGRNNENEIKVFSSQKIYFSLLHKLNISSEYRCVFFRERNLIFFSLPHFLWRMYIRTIEVFRARTLLHAATINVKTVSVVEVKVEM